MKDYIEERAIEIANFIIEEKATVRQTAKKFGVSKSTVHKDVTKGNAFSVPFLLPGKFCRYGSSPIPSRTSIAFFTSSSAT